MAYQKPMHYSKDELQGFLISDLMRDADTADEQAENGPYYPERGITKESLKAYANECRDKAGAILSRASGTAVDRAEKEHVEYISAAKWVAQRGLTGKTGDPLPANLNSRVLARINADPAQFQEAVREARRKRSDL